MLNEFLVSLRIPGFLHTLGVTHEIVTIKSVDAICQMGGVMVFVQKEPF